MTLLHLLLYLFPLLEPCILSSPPQPILNANPHTCCFPPYRPLYFSTTPNPHHLHRAHSHLLHLLTLFPSEPGGWMTGSPPSPPAPCGTDVSFRSRPSIHPAPSTRGSRTAVGQTLLAAGNDFPFPIDIKSGQPGSSSGPGPLPCCLPSPTHPRL